MSSRMSRRCIFFLFFFLLVLCISCRRSHNRTLAKGKKQKEELVNVSDSSIPKADSSIEVDNKKDKDISVLEDILIPNMPKSIKSKLLHRIAYITSYNSTTRNPNWVAWHLASEHTDGPFTRKGVPYYSEEGIVYGIGYVTQETCKNGYFVDIETKESQQQLSDWTRDYNMSHGHMCPAGDNKWDKAAMNQSFLLTNMCPQDEKLNGGGWKKLEEKCRSWANLYGSVFIVAGPVFNEPATRTLGKGKIAVPDAFFKVILCLEGAPKTIGFIYKNDSSNQPINDCACSVNNVEELTGFDFFFSLPDEIENVIESDSDLTKWN